MKTQQSGFALEINNLYKTYAPQAKRPAFQALKDVSLHVPQGSIFGLLGPNGAGKSTLINILAGLVLKTSGDVRVNGFDLDRNERLAKASIGVVAQEICYDAFFNPRDMLDIQAGFYGIPKAERKTDEILDFIGLVDKADSYARTLSGGMKRRLMIGKAMVHSPAILVLDEPTAGVDIDLRRQLWANVRKLNEQGVTIILTTHYLEEAEELCDEIAIINHGEIVTCEPTESLLSELDSKQLRLRLSQAFEAEDIPPALLDLGAEKKGQRSLVFNFSPKETPARVYIDAVQSAGFEIDDIDTLNSNLEDVFLELTKAA